MEEQQTQTLTPKPEDYDVVRQMVERSGMILLQLTSGATAHEHQLVGADHRCDGDPGDY